MHNFSNPSYAAQALQMAGSELARINQDLAQQGKHKNRASLASEFLADFQRASLASEFAKQLRNQIANFDQSLDEKHEVGMKLVSFGSSIKLHVSDVGYCNPGTILFWGLIEDGNKVELIQHVSQVSLLLIAVPKLKPEEPKRPIGFIKN
ncbi:MAG: DUF6173 family protein [Limnothrix sp.]